MRPNSICHYLVFKDQIFSTTYNVIQILLIKEPSLYRLTELLCQLFFYLLLNKN